ncbi:nuclear transport factor 2 family protein [Halomonas binhaiensis]|uniref:Nuclear transport factor 2 family protein n=1 Tax=Halomonas binhaiensis TaxID=2562282 RepID=A0A5C1NJV8_9GAMM|nr:nuclear transport factor 2 family protein [Halomonas binhaiensis]QEM83614.1 nuclear transport factor 2 family protein [Halomonas binhaiensis]
MEINISLEKVRKLWIEAYFKGDVDCLADIESPFFFVKSGETIISKDEQLSNVRKNRYKRLVNKCDIVDFRESIDEVREHPGCTTVSGRATVYCESEIVGRYDFFEVWMVVDDRWQIAYLCYEAI